MSTESLGLTENLKSDNILIDGFYTSMTEKGTWSYSSSTKMLTLRERNILEKWTDFRDAYGKSSELKFYLKQITSDKMKLCFDYQGRHCCDEYDRTYQINNGKKYLTEK